MRAVPLGILLFVAFLILFGCAAQDERIVEVKVKTPVPCLSPEDIPPPSIYPVDQLEKGVSDGEIIYALRTEREERKVVEQMLRDLLKPCIGEIK